MERNTATIAKELRVGDRFYKSKDRNKTVLQMVEHDVKKTYYQTYRYWCKSDTDKHPQPIKFDTQVIFLRHALDTPSPQMERAEVGH